MLNVGSMILVLTPLKMEHDALLSALGTPSGLTLAIGGHGKVEFALGVQSHIARLKPRLVICAGAGGALSPVVQPLDVVVATETIEHDFRLRFIKRPDPAFAGDSASIQKLQSLEFNFGVHFGRIASGDEDVVESLRAEEIRAQTQALAVAWEGAGGARAARANQTAYLEIRTVTDSSNENAAPDFAKNLKLGMVQVGEVIRRLL